jgi:metal-responsive CopG/Arc/MetJ family transcriptional regulator
VPTNERVTVTLPSDLVRDIDRREKNRSKFIQEAARRELERRRRDELARSLRSPHSDTAELAEAGFEETQRSATSSAASDRAWSSATRT